MMFELKQTIEAKNDVKKLAAYMSYSLKNVQAANKFLELYYKQIQGIAVFPLAYCDTSIKYCGYDIHMKVFSTYNIFYIVDIEKFQVIILRILKDRQNWKKILQREEEYHY